MSSPLTDCSYREPQAVMDDRRGKVLMGTCGWSDASASKMYPSSVRNAEQRLAVYSRLFPCVEVDTSAYVIPSPHHTKRWAAQTLPGFRFHFKAHGLFSHQAAPPNTLPRKARELLSPWQAAQPSLPRSGLPPGCEDACWAAFHEAMEPVRQADRLGCVVFQFHQSFHPSLANKDYVLSCRHKLDARLAMAVELRCRA
ncbi:hypothetical protein QJQ45_010362 [Haematococcus lacustris]|nr:hypothetical protein QJQ45_010362 [Haematococcus lacustris]